MLAKRIIPCLDVTAGRVVKGINFVELRDAGDPVEIAARYNEQGADELSFLDITATSDGRDVILHIIEAVASQVFIPLTVGGGVRTVDDVRRLLNAGADKTSFNSAAIANPQVIRDASQKYGAQCIVVAIDAKRRKGDDQRTKDDPQSRHVIGWAPVARIVGDPACEDPVHYAEAQPTYEDDHRDHQQSKRLGGNRNVGPPVAKHHRDAREQNADSRDEVHPEAGIEDRAAAVEYALEKLVALHRRD